MLYVVPPFSWHERFNLSMVGQRSLKFLFIMRLVIKENYDILCQYVAEYIIDRINKFNPTAEKPFVLGKLNIE